jgi:DNA repair exonuclease SbcCD nuclease subunit
VKILAFGDLHLGAGADYRLRDQEKVLGQIVELARGVEFVLFSGDVFHRRRPGPEEQRVWRDFVYNLETPLLAIAGNHDVSSAETISAMELPLFKAYTVARKPGTHFYGDVAVSCLPWAPAAHVVAARNGDRTGLSEDIAEVLVKQAADLYDSASADTGTNILLAHWAVSGFSLPTGLATEELREPVLPLTELQKIGYDWIVLGHIHATAKRGNTFYTSSPCVVDWGEANSEHGCWVIDTLGDATFHALQDRRFLTITPEALDGGIRPDVDDGALVRIRGAASADFDQEFYRRRLLEMGAESVSFQIDTVREDRPQIEGVDEELGVLEAMKLYCERAELDEETLLDRAAGYLEDVA